MFNMNRFDENTQFSTMIENDTLVSGLCFAPCFAEEKAKKAKKTTAQREHRDVLWTSAQLNLQPAF